LFPFVDILKTYEYLILLQINYLKYETLQILKVGKKHCLLNNKSRNKIVLDKNGVPFNGPVDLVSLIFHELNQFWKVGEVIVLKTDHRDVNHVPR